MYNVDAKQIYFGNGDAIFRDLLYDVDHLPETENLTVLRKIMNRHGCQQNFGWQSQPTLFDELFKRYMPKLACMMEIDFSNNVIDMQNTPNFNSKYGASLRVWHEYFEACRVIGIDSNRSALIEEREINSFFVDVKSADAIDAFNKVLPHVKIDLLIDSSISDLETKLIVFEKFSDKVRPGGLYIITNIPWCHENKVLCTSFMNTKTLTGFLCQVSTSLSYENRAVAVVRFSDYSRT